MIKISFSGLSGSGKTSLLAEVKKILSLKYKVDSIEEARGKNPFDSDKKSCFVSQFFYVSTQINEENKKSLAPPDFLLCDQSALDQWIAWRHYTSDKEKTPQILEKDDVMKTLYRFWIKTYQLIFLIRTDPKELEKRELKNELRIADADDITQIEELYKERVKEDNLKVIEIWNNNTIDESAHEILKHISEFAEMEIAKKENEKENEHDNEKEKENGNKYGEYGNQTGGV